MHKPADKSTRGPLRALSEWLRGATPAPQALAPQGTPPPEAPAAPEGQPGRIGHYAIAGKLGEGGMGIVYLAHDEVLGRAVAVKTMSLSGDESARARFRREARAAAAINHPNVCQIYEVGEDDGEMFIAMELLEGETLADRLRRGGLSVSETLPIGLGVLSALQALHARGVIHRDLKPTNVFLTAHGVKLLDFGLARAVDPDLAQSLAVTNDVTRTGMLVGTPRYMAPEQVRGEGLDFRSDLFAVGAILFEMLAARPAFDGKNPVEILHGTLYEQPPALTGSPAVAAVDRVIRRALAKRPSERPASADEMAGELRAVRVASGDDMPALAKALTRLVVLPFRVLRPDPETDFLAFSLADAIATSLSRIGSLVVRSSAAASRFAGETPDLAALASAADVDRVVMGTIVRSGDQLRATAQLVEAPGGTLVASHTVQSPLGDLFQLQDDIARRVVEALALPLGGVADTPTPQRPQDAGAYALYLRANEFARTYTELHRARDLYQQCLELDPGFAPAWAQLGRCYRVINKFVDATEDGVAKAEEAFRRALEINPRLTLAHKYYANHEAETGQPRAAMVRLLGEATRHGNDPELFAGLVHACRYCGLFEQSMAAHEEARRLDPNVASSVEETLLMSGDLERLVAMERKGPTPIQVVGLGLSGRRDEARVVLAELRQQVQIPLFATYTEALLGWLDRRPGLQMWSDAGAMKDLKIFDDPEAIFQEGWLLCDAGAHDRGLPLLQRAVAKGYAVAATLARSPAFDALRGETAFRELLARADADREKALTTFRESGGEKLLGR